MSSPHQDSEKPQINRYNVIHVALIGYESPSYLSKHGQVEFSVSEDRQEIDMDVQGPSSGTKMLNMCPEDVYCLRKVFDEIISMIESAQMQELL